MGVGILDDIGNPFFVFISIKLQIEQLKLLLFTLGGRLLLDQYRRCLNNQALGWGSYDWTPNTWLGKSPLDDVQGEGLLSTN